MLDSLSNEMNTELLKEMIEDPENANLSDEDLGI
jgi:hypothetical protein